MTLQRRQSRKGRSPSRGFVLIALLALLSMGTLYFIAVQVEALGRYQLEAREGSSSGSTAINQALQALIAYAVTYPDNRADQVFGFLPCPDTTGNGEAASTCGSADHAAVGLLPYKTLGLPELRDAQGDCLWYAVGGSFKNSPKSATLTMNSDTQGQFKIVDANGSILVQPDDGQGGAAAVVFSPGAPISGQSRSTSSSGICQVDPTAQTSYLDGNYSFAQTSTIILTQGSQGGATSGVTNNDRLVWVTPKQIFDAIKKRGDFATTINSLSSHLVSSLAQTTPGAALPSHDVGTATAVGTTKLTGKFPATTNVPAIPFNFQVYRDNWRDLYRYVTCTPSSPTNKCLTVNGQSCMGTLIFAGQNPAGGPRTTTEKSDDSTYIDSINWAAYSSTASNTFSGGSSFAAANPTQDTFYCLNSPDLTQITGTSGFTATAGSTALVSSLDTSGRIGASGTSTSTRRACVWSPDPIDFQNGLSVYFLLTINTRDVGTVLTIADTTNNPSTTNLCGTAGTNGMNLGYAGTSSGNSIKAPKIGLELDMRRDASLSTDPDFSVTALNRHAGFIYWGTGASTDDDNTHGAGTLGSNTEPKSPTSVTIPPTTGGIVTESFSNGAAYHVRLDIRRVYAAPVGTYTLTAYLYLTTTSSTLACRSLLSDPDSITDFFSNIDTGGLCTPTITDTITINDSLTGGAEAMKSVFLGFTTAQRSNNRQFLQISNFIAQNH